MTDAQALSPTSRSKWGFLGEHDELVRFYLMLINSTSGASIYVYLRALHFFNKTYKNMDKLIISYQNADKDTFSLNAERIQELQK